MDFNTASSDYEGVPELRQGAVSFSKSGERDAEPSDVDMVDVFDESPIGEIKHMLTLMDKCTDELHIRGVSIVALIKDNGIRIYWEPRDKILMIAHCAKHQLHLGNCEVLYLSELKRSLGLKQYCIYSDEYNHIVEKKLGPALKYCLYTLAKAGHVQLARRKLFFSMWKSYTEAWGLIDWDGDITPPTEGAMVSRRVTVPEAQSLSGEQSSETPMDWTSAERVRAWTVEQPFPPTPLSTSGGRVDWPEKQSLATDDEAAIFPGDSLSTLYANLRVSNCTFSWSASHCKDHSEVGAALSVQPDVVFRQPETPIAPIKKKSD